MRLKLKICKELDLRSNHVRPGISMSMSFCPCGKDITDIKFAYHKYRCPKQVKQTQSAQPETQTSSAKDRVLPNTTESEVTSATGNSSQKKARPRACKVKGKVCEDPVSDLVKVKSKPASKVKEVCADNLSECPASDVVKLKTVRREKDDVSDVVKVKTKCASRVKEKFTEDVRECPVRHVIKVKTNASSEVTETVANDPSKGRMGDAVKLKTKSVTCVTEKVQDDKSECPASDVVKVKTVRRVKEKVPDDIGVSPLGEVVRVKTKAAPKIKEKLPEDICEGPFGDVVKVKTKAASARSYRPGTTSSSGRDIIDTSELDDFVDRMVKEKVIQHSDNPEQDVKKFFDDEVKMTQCDITNVQKHFKILRDKVVGRLNCETELGGWDYRNGGSHADGTKVARPDEMDCILFPRLSTRLQAVFDDDCQPGFCKVKVVGREEDHDIGQFCDGEFLNSRQFRNFIFQKLEYIVDKDRLLKDIRKYPDSLSFAIKYTGIPTETGMKSIDMDFVPSVHIRQWPRGKVARDISLVMQDKGKAEKIKLYGFNATPKQCTTGSKSIRDLMWQVSFSYAEKKLTKHADKTCWKPVLRTIKRIVEIAIANSEFCARSKSNKLEQITTAAQYAQKNCKLEFQYRFTTYHIRTLMWTLLYDLTAGEHVWTVDTKAIRLRFTLGKLQKMLTGEMVVPHFFLPEVKDIMRGVWLNERKFLYIIARATEIIFSKKP